MYRSVSSIVQPRGRAGQIIQYAHTDGQKALVAPRISHRNALESSLRGLFRQSSREHRVSGSSCRAQSLSRSNQNAVHPIQCRKPFSYSHRFPPSGH